MGSERKYHSKREFPFFKTPLWLFQLAYSVKCRWTHRSHLYNNIMHAMGELFFSSQPTATTCLVWSWCVKGCLCICLGRKRQGVWSQVRLYWLCHTDEPQEERNSCPGLPLPRWYVCVHAYSIGPTTELVRVLQCFLCIELMRSIQCNYPSTVRERKVLHLFALSTKQ